MRAVSTWLADRRRKPDSGQGLLDRLAQIASCDVTDATLEITVGRDLAGDLHRWLAGESDLRVRDVDGTPGPGELGASTDTLAVILAPGGAVVVVVSGLVSWLRSRTSDVRVVVRRGDREVSLAATRVARLDAADLAVMIESVAGQLDDGE